MARQHHRIGADIGADIDEHAANWRVAAQEIELLAIIVGIEQRAAFGGAELMIEAEGGALVVHVDGACAHQVDQPRQHRAERATLQPRALRKADDRGLRHVRRKRTKGHWRSIVVGRQANVLDQGGGHCIAGFVRKSNQRERPERRARLGASTRFGACHAAFFCMVLFAVLRWRRKRPSKRCLPLRGMRSTSLTSLALPLCRSSTIWRLWKASSSTRCATLMMVAFGSSPVTIFIILSWLFSSSAEVASSSTTMSGLCKSSRAKASLCFSPPD